MCRKYFIIREAIKSVIKILHAHKVRVNGYQYKIQIPTLERCVLEFLNLPTEATKKPRHLLMDLWPLVNQEPIFQGVQRAERSYLSCQKANNHAGDLTKSLLNNEFNSGNVCHPAIEYIY